MTRKILITGCSSGFGLGMTIAFAKQGDFVIATIRNMQKKEIVEAELMKHQIADRVVIYPLDIDEESSIEAFENVLKKEGPVDILVNNAGYALAGFSEKTDIGAYQKQFQTNLFGTISITQKVLPFMRSRKAGRIINIGSISGRVSYPFLSPYAASKHALEGWSESLALEVAPFGIYVSLIEAGSYQTSIWGKGEEMLASEDKAIYDYQFYEDKMTTLIHGGQKNYGDPADVVQKVLQISGKKHPKLRYPIGSGVRLTILAKNLLPWRIWKWIVLKRIGVESPK